MAKYCTRPKTQLERPTAENPAESRLAGPSHADGQPEEAAGHTCTESARSTLAELSAFCAASLRRRAPSHFRSLQGIKFFYGVGFQIRRQAGHGAAQSSATYLEAAELIPRPAEANAQIFFERPTAIYI